MRILIALPFLFAACQSNAEPAPATDAQVVEKMKATALAFADALEHFDFAAAKAHAAPAAHGYLEAEGQFWSQMFDRPEQAPGKAVLRSAQRDGERGVVEVAIEGRDAARSIFVHLERAEGEWGVFGFGTAADDEPRLFAEQEAGARERLQQVLEQVTPHPELGPLVEAYVAAAEIKDLNGMTRNMTAACKDRQLSGARSFTKLFVEGTIAIDRWQFDGHDDDGTRPTQRVRTILRLENGETDNEPMRFEFVRAADGWKIDAIN